MLFLRIKKISNLLILFVIEAEKNQAEMTTTLEKKKSNFRSIWCSKETEHVAWLENSRRLSSHAYILTLIRIQPLSLNPFAPFCSRDPSCPSGIP